MTATDGSSGKGSSGFVSASLSSFRPLAQVYAYWDALRGGRPLPLRSEVDPRGIESALDFTFILERVAPQVSRFRLAGTQLSDLMGMEVRGMPATCLFTAASRGDAAADIDRVFSDPAIAEFNLTAESSFGRPPLAARLLILPMRSDLGDISRALGCLVTDGLTGRSPRKFAVSDVRLRGLTSGPATIRIIPDHDREPVDRGFAELARGYIPAPGPTTRPGQHLRLVKTDA